VSGTLLANERLMCYLKCMWNDGALIWRRYSLGIIRRPGLAAAQKDRHANSFRVLLWSTLHGCGWEKSDVSDDQRQPMQV